MRDTRPMVSTEKYHSGLAVGAILRARSTLNPMGIGHGRRVIVLARISTVAYADDREVSRYLVGRCKRSGEEDRTAYKDPLGNLTLLHDHWTLERTVRIEFNRANGLAQGWSVVGGAVL